MDKFIPREKLSKKEKKRRAAAQRSTWSFSPATRKVESRKVYNRKKISRSRHEDGLGGFLLSVFSPSDRRAEQPALP